MLEWKPVVYRGKTYSSYEVSTGGVVRTIDHWIRDREYKGRELKPRKKGCRKGQTPYYQIALFDGSRGSRIDAPIHRVVAETFIPNPEGKGQVNHLNGDKTDNSVANLEWCTPTENIRHGFRTGLIASPKGAAHGRTKLTDDEVTYIYLRIKGRPRGDMNFSAIGRKFGVDGKAVDNIYRKAAWKWLTDDIDKEDITC